MRACQIQIVLTALNNPCLGDLVSVFSDAWVCFSSRIPFLWVSVIQTGRVRLLPLFTSHGPCCNLLKPKPNPNTPVITHGWPDIFSPMEVFFAGKTIKRRIFQQTMSDTRVYIPHQMGVSWDKGTSKSSIFIGLSLTKTIQLWGTPMANPQECSASRAKLLSAGEVSAPQKTYRKFDPGRTLSSNKASWGVH